MNKKIKFIPILLAVLLVLGIFTACSRQTEETTQTQEQAQTQAQTQEQMEGIASKAEALAAQSDITVNTDGATVITLAKTSATIEGDGAKADGSDVLITGAGTYVLSGTLTDGRILVDADGENVTLVFDGVDITCSDSSPLYVYQAKSVILYLQKDSKNTLTDGSKYVYTDSYSSEADEEPNACIYAKDDLSIAGSGALTVKANYNTGIVCKDTLLVENAAIAIEAANNGITGKDALNIKKASITVKAGGDALRATNDTDTECGYILIAGAKLALTAEEDGVQAQTYLAIVDSKMSVKTGGGSATTPNESSSTKGIKAETDIDITGGTFKMDTSDDSIHAGGTVHISEAALTLATGDDGIHADNTVIINSGKLAVDGREGIEATYITINGGTVSIKATDDGINAAKQIDGSTPRVEINGGDITIEMGQGDTDAIDSNGDIIINDGTLNITAQSPFDYDNTGELNGGTVYVNGEKVSEMTNQFGGMGGQGGMGGGMGAPGGQGGEGGPGGMQGAR